MTHAPSPPAYTMLLAKVVPPFGNDTMFSNMCAVVNDLPLGTDRVMERVTISGRAPQAAT